MDVRLEPEIERYARHGLSPQHSQQPLGSTLEIVRVKY